MAAATYLGGLAAKDYIDESMFIEAGIQLVYKEYPAVSRLSAMLLPLLAFCHAIGFTIEHGVGSTSLY